MTRSALGMVRRGIGALWARLLSKSVTATLPAGILLMLLWRNGRLSWRSDVLPLLPWFAVGAGAGLFTAWVERTYIGAQGQASILGSLSVASWQEGSCGSISASCSGPRSSPSFTEMARGPHGDVEPRDDRALGVGGGPLPHEGMEPGAAARPPLLRGLPFPALGFFNVYPFLFSYVADHWQYLPCLGIIALACQGGAAVVSGIAVRGVPKPSSPYGGGRRCRGRCGPLHAHMEAERALPDIPALYADTLAKNPSCWMAHNNLGVYLDESGSRAEAISHLRKACCLSRTMPKRTTTSGTRSRRSLQ